MTIDAQAALQWEQSRADRQGTHGYGCADWGPAHYECAIRERDDLRRQLDEARAEREAMANVLPGHYYMDPPDGGDVPVLEQLRRMAKDAERYRWLRGREDGRYMTVYAFRTDIDEVCLGDELDAAIDAAMGLTRPAERG